MHLTKGLLAASALLAGVHAAPAPAAPPASAYSAADISSGNALKDLNKKAYDAALKLAGSTKASRDVYSRATCNAGNIKIRQEW